MRNWHRSPHKVGKLQLRQIYDSMFGRRQTWDVKTDIKFKKIREDYILLFFFQQYNPDVNGSRRFMKPELEIVTLKWSLLILPIIPALWAWFRTVLYYSGFWTLVPFPTAIFWAFEANFCCLTCTLLNLDDNRCCSISFHLPFSFPTPGAHWGEVRVGLPA